jgi:hypothetical protein
MERFLAQVAGWPRPITAYMGVNTMYVRDDVVRRCIAEHPRLSLNEVYRQRHLPSGIYILRNDAGARA